MKRKFFILCLVLSLCMAFLAGCSSAGSESADASADASSDIESNETDASSDLSIEALEQEEITMEGVLFENEYCIISYSGRSYDEDYMSHDFFVTIENISDEGIIYIDGLTAVNNYMVDGVYLTTYDPDTYDTTSVEVIEPGETIYGVYYIDDEMLEEYGMSGVGTLDLSFEFCNEDYSEELFTAQAQITADFEEDISINFDVEGETVFNEAGVSITYLGTEYSDIYESDVASFYITNDSGLTVTLSTEYYIDGEEVLTYILPADLFDGCCSLSTLNLYKEDAETLQINLSVVDQDWEALTEEQTITIEL